METKQARHSRYVARKRAKRRKLHVGKKKQLEQERMAIRREAKRKHQQS